LLFNFYYLNIISGLKATHAKWLAMTNSYISGLSEQGVKPNDRQALSPPQTGLGISPGRCQYRYIHEFIWQKMMLEVVI